MARRRHSTTSGPAPLPWVRWAPRASLCHTCTTTTATTTCHRRSSSRSRCLPRAQSGSPSLRLRCRSRLSTAPRRRCRMPRRRTASRHRRRLTSRAAPRLRTFCLLSLSPVMCGCAHLCWNLRRRATCVVCWWVTANCHLDRPRVAPVLELVAQYVAPHCAHGRQFTHARLLIMRLPSPMYRSLPRRAARAV